MDGLIVKFDQAHGYGFLRPLIGSPSACHDVFFHCTALLDTQHPPLGARASFKLVDGRKGPQAADVRILQVSGSQLCGKKPYNESALPRSGRAALPGTRRNRRASSLQSSLSSRPALSETPNTTGVLFHGC
jgi:cold shock CspA family protein